MVVGAVMVFAGISMATGKPLDAGTFGMAGLIVGHYFSQDTKTALATAVVAAATATPEPLAPPFTGEPQDD